jgi:hypothetical protein
MTQPKTSVSGTRNVCIANEDNIFVISNLCACAVIVDLVFPGYLTKLLLFSLADDDVDGKKTNKVEKKARKEAKSPRGAESQEAETDFTPGESMLKL